MQQTPIPPQHREHSFPRRAIVSSLITGLVLGLLAGIPAGWFTHRLFYQQRAAQVLLCRQQHYGLPEVELQRTCGSVF